MNDSPYLESGSRLAYQKIPLLYETRRVMTTFTAPRAVHWNRWIQYPLPHNFLNIRSIFSFHLLLDLPSRLFHSSMLIKILHILMTCPIGANNSEQSSWFERSIIVTKNGNKGSYRLAISFRKLSLYSKYFSQHPVSTHTQSVFACCERQHFTEIQHTKCYFSIFNSLRF